MSRELRLFVTIDLSSADLAPFEDYERQVLALLPEHRGELVARWRLNDGATEHHLITFVDRHGYDSFMADPRRAAIRHLWELSGATIAVDEVKRG